VAGPHRRRRRPAGARARPPRRPSGPLPRRLAPPVFPDAVAPRRRTPPSPASLAIAAQPPAGRSTAAATHRGELRRPPPGRGKVRARSGRPSPATASPLHLRPPRPRRSSRRTRREQCREQYPRDPDLDLSSRLTFSPLTLVFMHTLTARNFASVAPFWAYDISKSSPRHVHHFIPLRHLHLRPS